MMFSFITHHLMIVSIPIPIPIAGMFSNHVGMIPGRGACCCCDEDDTLNADESDRLLVKRLLLHLCCSLPVQPSFDDEYVNSLNEATQLLKGIALLSSSTGA